MTHWLLHLVEVPWWRWLIDAAAALLAIVAWEYGKRLLAEKSRSEEER